MSEEHQKELKQLVEKLVQDIREYEYIDHEEWNFVLKEKVVVEIILDLIEQELKHAHES